jgi:hypothetical protein
MLDENGSDATAVGTKTETVDAKTEIAESEEEDVPTQTTNSTNVVSAIRDKGKGAETLADATTNHSVNGERLKSLPISPRAEMSGSGSEGDEPIYSPLALRARMSSGSAAPRAGAETMSLLLVDDNVRNPAPLESSLPVGESAC